MSKTTAPPTVKKPKQPGLSSLLTPYRGTLALLILLALLSNGINLLVPALVSRGIDAYTHQHLVMKEMILQFVVAALSIFLFGWLQSIVQTYASERVARDLRTRLADKISRQSHGFIQQAGPAKLLTNLTSDIDSIKLFVSQAVVSITSSIVIILGVTVLLLSMNWRLALIVLIIIPVIGFTFFSIMKKVKPYFMQAREVIDWLNKVINESILGSALIRLINSQQLEYQKFLEANTKALNMGVSIVRIFATLIPVIILSASLAALCILVLGGHFVIGGSMTLGNFAAFNSYLAMVIMPILIIGFMSNLIAQATASFHRVNQVLTAPDTVDSGTIREPLQGTIEVKDLSLTYGEKLALKDISFRLAPGSRTAIIGPTAAGKTQLLYLLTDLIQPGTGSILYDGRPIEEYEKENFHRQVGFVFQDSIIFNMSVRENIAFSDTVSDEDLQKAIGTAELRDFIDALPEKLDTVVSERGNSLSGGQKQRIMLARALAMNPTILLLDDFTARVDANTEKKILENVQKNYPGLTLLSVTQKIEAIEDYDQIIVLMEGEMIATGKHAELMASSPEYVQIYQSQQSTSHYETAAAELS